MPDTAFVKGSPLRQGSGGQAGAAGALAHVIAQVRQRWLLRSIAFAIAAAGAAFALTLVVSPVLLSIPPSSATWVAVMVAAGAGLAPVARGPRLSAVDAARVVERVYGSMHNLLVTAAELEARPRPVRAEIGDEVFRQASEQALSVDAAQAVPLAQPITVAAVVLAGCVALFGVAQSTRPGFLSRAPLGTILSTSTGSFNVRVTPPAYTGRSPETFENPVQVSVLAGSRVQIAAVNRDWIATESEAIEIKAAENAEVKFLSVMVTPDFAPTLRIVTPGKDAAFATPAGRVPITIHSGDDLGLAALSLRFTKASGGGENVSFSEGEVPLRIERGSGRDWRGQGEIVLDALDLDDGDILVYRAIARDTNPRGQPVQSDQYVIEIGKNAEIADAGFALPSEEKKYAISQQMVIYRTEQLLMTRPPDVLYESRGIGVEQRMVRAEVVFLGGGEVQDEVEEAAQSDELVEGRLQNTGRAEMLRAINAMSKAEAQLNDGRAKEALVFEREALLHLERALDRRRYFLRTLPDRSRIDATRRLTGERRDAESWDRDAAVPAAPAGIEALRRVMRELAAGADANASLAARVAAIDPSSAELQKVAVTLASAATASARQTAMRDAMAALTRHALRALPASSAIDLRMDPLAGALAGELDRSARPRQ